MTLLCVNIKAYLVWAARGDNDSFTRQLDCAPANLATDQEGIVALFGGDVMHF
jgi:hypothetical protein